MNKPKMKPAAKNADPMIKAIRNEQIRQGISDYKLGPELGISSSSLVRIWNATNMPGVPMIRRIVEVLRKENPNFTTCL